ncbi:MAG: hypothetical protein JWQ36_1668 [Enterovirga sp.]|jgi:uncharacterized protein (DUF924 family)|nr:hypothetical protein [Enterovirga sp.]
MDMAPRPGDVLEFWREAGPGAWFTKNPAFDELCRSRFLHAYQQAAAGALPDWERSADGALALVILLDQMPRNMFRGDPRTWATDPDALAVATRALDAGYDQQVAPDLRPFFYLPFMHAEDLDAQERSVALYTALGDPENLTFAHHHHGIIARFGRFPHRNAVLGRETTPEEAAFLEEDPFRG